MNALTDAAAALLPAAFPAPSLVPSLVPSRVPGPGSGVVLAQAQELTNALNRLRNVIVGLLGGLATLILTYAGVLYLTAAGDPAQVERAKGALRAAAVGYGIAILAPALFEMLRQIAGG